MAGVSFGQPETRKKPPVHRVESRSEAIPIDSSHGLSREYANTNQGREHAQRAARCTSTHVLTKSEVTKGLLMSNDVSENPPRIHPPMRSPADSQSSSPPPAAQTASRLAPRTTAPVSGAECPAARSFSRLLTPSPPSKSPSLYTSARSTSCETCSPFLGVSDVCNTGKRALAPCTAPSTMSRFVKLDRPGSGMNALRLHESVHSRLRRA